MKGNEVLIISVGWEEVAFEPTYRDPSSHLLRDIKKVPERKVCKECDLRVYCGREGAIRLGEVDDSILSGQG